MNEPDPRRITLISRSEMSPDRSWRVSRDSPRRLIIAPSFGVIPFALAHGIGELEVDIEAVVIDGTATAEDFLTLLATLPPAFLGDVVLILRERAYVSAMTRGDGRVMYALRPEDVTFYLETKMLVDAATVSTLGSLHAEPATAAAAA